MLFLSHLYPNATTPHEAAFNRQLAMALARRVPLTVMAPILCPPWWLLTARRHITALEMRDGLTVHHPRVCYTPGLLLSRHAAMMRWALRRPLRRVLDALKPESVLLGFLYPDVVAVAPLLREWRIPYAIRLNGSDFYARINHPRLGPGVRRELELATAIVCPGERLAVAVRTALGCLPEKIRAFRNGVDRSRFYPVAKPIKMPPGRSEGGNQGDSVLFVGHLKRGKGVDRLIRAWAEMRVSTEVGGRKAEIGRLLIVGAGGERGRLARLARTLKVADSIEFAGILPHAAVAAVMRQARCVCLPSHSEGMPNVVLEALACGVPVVATDVGEIPELVRDGVNGMVVETGGRAEEQVIADLAKALRRVMGRTWDPERIAATVADCDWDRAAAVVIAALGD